MEMPIIETMVIRPMHSQTPIELKRVSCYASDGDSIIIHSPGFSGLLFNLDSEISYSFEEYSVTPVFNGGFEKPKYHQINAYHCLLLSSPPGNVSVQFCHGIHRLLFVTIPFDFISIFEDVYPVEVAAYNSAAQSNSWYFPSPSPLVIPFEMRPVMETLFDVSLLRYLITNEFAYALVVDMIIYYLSRHDIQNVDPIVSQAKRILTEKYHIMWTLDLLADTLFVTKKKLGTRFKKFYGVGPMEYLRAVRMQIAANLLKQNFSVSEVARRLGYKHAGDFTRAFHNHHKISPKQIGIPPRPE